MEVEAEMEVGMVVVMAAALVVAAEMEVGMVV